MKTLKTFYLLTLSTLLSLAACSKDEGSDTPQPLTIEQTEYTLDAIDNRSTTLSFTASAAWTLSVSGEDADWLTVTPAIGTAGSKSVTLTAAPRITEESRTAYVDIACGAQTVQITVTQTGHPPMRISPRSSTRYSRIFWNRKTLFPMWERSRGKTWKRLPASPNWKLGVATAVPNL